jgi:hypothetical protein
VAAPLSVHTHTHMCALLSETNFWPDDQEKSNQNVDDYILRKVTVMLSEIILCVLQEE